MTKPTMRISNLLSDLPTVHLVRGGRVAEVLSPQDVKKLLGLILSTQTRVANGKDLQTRAGVVSLSLDAPQELTVTNKPDTTDQRKTSRTMSMETSTESVITVIIGGTRLTIPPTTGTQDFLLRISQGPSQ